MAHSAPDSMSSIHFDPGPTSTVAFDMSLTHAPEGLLVGGGGGGGGGAPALVMVGALARAFCPLLPRCFFEATEA